MAKNGGSNGKRRKLGTYIAIPHHVLKSEQGKALTGPELRLLAHLLLQYNGHNNGNLSPTFTLMKEYGWTSTGTLYKARQGLEHKGFIVVTKEGKKVRGDCTLVAVTWLGIHEPKKWDYDEGIKVNEGPLNFFRLPKEQWSIQPSSKPPK